MQKFFRSLVVILFLTYNQSVSPFCKTEDFLGKGKYSGEYWPTKEWRICQPEEVGIRSDRLLEVFKYAANPRINTQGLVIIRKGYIVGEAYFGDFTRDSRHESFSIAKSFTSALIGIAIEKGFLKGVEEKVSKFYPEWQKPETQEAKKRVTIRHLLTMTSGLEWNEEDYYKDRSQNDVYKMIESSEDYLQYVLEKPVTYEPGSRWYYSSGDSMLLSGVIEKSTKMDVFEFASRYLFKPLGLENIIWLKDPANHTITAWGIQATLREFAKFGYLYLKKGKWQNKQIIPEKWIEESLSPVSEKINHYGYQWWLLPALKGYENSNIPRGTFLAWGIYTQQIFVIPEKDLVIVRLGNDADPYNDEWIEVEFLTFVLDSLVD